VTVITPGAEFDTTLEHSYPQAQDHDPTPASCGPRFWVTPEYMLWWIKRGPLATPLVTTTTNPFVFDANGNSISGGLGVPGTVTLFGPDSMGYNPLNGGRLTAGGWLNEQETVGFTARGFLFEQASIQKSFQSGPDGNPVIGIPINDVANTVSGGENAITESFPLSPFGGGFMGGDTVISHSRLWGGDANILLNLFRNESLTVNGMVGFRYANLREDITLIGQSTNILDVNAVPIPGGVAFLNNFFNGTVTSYDTFSTRNQFYGGQLGAEGTATFGKFFVDLSGTVALGSTHQVVQIGGLSTLSATNGTIPPPFPTIAPGGTLAVPSNIGSFTRDRFSVIPEVDGKVGYAISQSISCFVGYSFMYWSSVVRPGDQIDRFVDLRQVPTLPFYDPTVKTLPPPHFQSSNFWAQGISVGLQFSF